MRGGEDLRAICIHPAWLMVLEKIALPFVKNLIDGKISLNQFGFKEHSDCNLAKAMVVYNAKKKGMDKLILIDVRKAFDSIDRIILRRKIIELLGNNGYILQLFIDIYDMLNIEILGTKISPTIGGPQGDVLVPIMFNIYLNDIIQIINT
ncbi:MAG: reverse transcriptase domain-containing protein [Bacteroidales bacterium]